MNLKNILHGITILSGYYDDPEGYHLGAEHDTLYLYATDRPLTRGDIELMIKLNWCQVYDERETGVDFEPKDYRPEESWVAYV